MKKSVKIHKLSAKQDSQNLRPLCVDLDGTLLLTDVLWESLLILLKMKPLCILQLPIWLLKGKAFFKRRIANFVLLNPETLPYNEDVLTFLKEERRAGREIILTTASDQKVAASIANFLGIFSMVLASDGKVNLAGQQKLKAITQNVDSKGFDYIGNAIVDIPLWQAAHQALLVHPSKSLVRQVQRVSSIYKLFSSRKNRFASLFKALRIYQWVKNILLFVPLLVSHKVTEINLVFQVIYAFFAFSFCASGVYIVNDLLDLESDRQHYYKKLRPFATGTLSIKAGIISVPLLVGTGFTISFFLLSYQFIYLLLIYLLITTAYSLHLKQVVIADVLVLALLYTLRVLAGGVAVSITISPWLFAFSIFLFVNLAFIKRYSELSLMHQLNETILKGRGYNTGDKELIRSVGPASGYISVLVFALYINSNEVVELYQHPQVLWLMGPFLLYWITRMWFLAHRGEMLDDPIVFAIKDLRSYGVGAILAIIMIIASF